MLGIFVMLQLNASLVEMIPTAMQDVRNSTLFVTGTQLFKLVAVLVAAVVFRTVRSIVVACMVAAALSVAILLRYLYQRFGAFWKHFDRKFFIEQLSYAAPLGAYGIVWVFRKDLDNYFISAMYSPAQYAIYSIGWLEVPLISLFLESMLSVMVVRISALHQQGRTEDIRNVLASAINRLATVQFPIYAILLVAGRDLIVFFYTKAYAASAPIFYITITLIVLNVFMYDPIVRAYLELRKFILVVRIGVLVRSGHCARARDPSLWHDRRGDHGRGGRPDRTAHRRPQGLPNRRCHMARCTTAFGRAARCRGGCGCCPGGVRRAQRRRNPASVRQACHDRHQFRRGLPCRFLLLASPGMGDRLQGPPAGVFTVRPSAPGRSSVVKGGFWALGSWLMALR